jgi:hypothetical protein
MNDTIQYIHWINHGVALGYLIACYLFFFSLAEGTHIVSHLSWLYYRQSNYRPLEKVGSFLSFVILAFVSLFLIYDLGHPERALTMLYHWNWTAPVAYGFYVVLFCIIAYAFHSYYLFRPEMAVKAKNGGRFAGLYKLLLFGNPEEGSTEEIRRRHAAKERFWANTSVTMSIIGLIYLGVLLSSFKGRVAWNSAMTIFNPVYENQKCTQQARGPGRSRPGRVSGRPCPVTKICRNCSGRCLGYLFSAASICRGGWRGCRSDVFLRTPGGAILDVSGSYRPCAAICRFVP